VRVKICGITRIEDAILCAELGADAIGFIFYKNSKRFIEYATAKSIIDALPFFIHKVGVFVDQSIDIINQKAKSIGLTAVQLHGNETQSDIEKINLPVIKALRISDESDLYQINNYKNCKILLDAFSNNELGGTGKKFNWNLIPEEIKNNIILSGGIKINDLEFIFSQIKPEGIDLSSGVEVLPGIKDHKILTEFFIEYRKLRGY
jgi:phosphoribosylanthranilate isomerase